MEHAEKVRDRRSFWVEVVRGVARWAWLPLLVLALLLTVDVCWQAWGASGPGRPRPGLLRIGPVAERILFPIAVVVATTVAWKRVTRRTPSSLNWLVVLSALTVLLGWASYAQPADRTPAWGPSWIVVLTRILDLFTSNAGPIADPPPLAFEFARLGGVVTVLVAAIGVVLRVWRTELDRLWVRFGLDLDVVVGVSPASLALVRQLVAERAAEPVFPAWRRWQFRQVLSRIVASWWSGVVLVHPNRDDPVVSEYRALGCHVLIADPKNSRQLLSLAVTARRPAVRRLFAAHWSEAENRSLVDALHRILEGDLGKYPHQWLLRPLAFLHRIVLKLLVPEKSLGWVPRLVAVMDDPREARDFRLAHVDSTRSFVDALCPQELLARDVVVTIDRHARTDVVILGNGPLALAILDEIALQGAFRAELHQLAADTGGPEEPKLSIQRVILADPEAALVRQEWLAFRAPAAVDAALEVTAVDHDHEMVLAELDDSSLAVIIAADPSGSVRTSAIRVNRMHPSALVFCPDRRAEGLDLTADLPGSEGQAVLGFGVSLLQGGHVPEDYWTVLARQAHEAYRITSRGTHAARRHWRDAGAAQQERLPAFFREDNISQQRHVMAEVARLLADRASAPGWRSVTPEDIRATLSNRDLTTVAAAEHARWCALRQATGWRCGPKSMDKLEQEWQARNPNLVAWETAIPLDGSGAGRAADPAGAAELQQWNVDTVAALVARLYVAGFAPTASAAGTAQVYRRLPVRVRAQVLDEPRQWMTSGGSRLQGRAGDWWVEDAAGVGRSVAAEEFAHLYAALPEPDGRFTHVRTGSVLAHQCAEPASVTTLEGDVHAARGDWVVIDGDNRWVVPDDRFRESYGPVVDSRPL